MIEVKGTMIAHHWDGNKSVWIPDTPAGTPIPPQVSLTGHESTSSPMSAVTQQSSGGTSSQSGNLATDAIDAAAHAARIEAAKRSFTAAMDLMNQIGK